MSGFLALPRDVLDIHSRTAWFPFDFPVASLYAYLVNKANWCDGTVPLPRQKGPLKMGQILFCQRQLAQDLNIGRKALRIRLARLVFLGRIEIEANSLGTIVSIKDYSKLFLEKPDGISSPNLGEKTHEMGPRGGTTKGPEEGPLSGPPELLNIGVIPEIYNDEFELSAHVGAHEGPTKGPRRALSRQCDKETPRHVIQVPAGEPAAPEDHPNDRVLDHQYEAPPKAPKKAKAKKPAEPTEGSMVWEAYAEAYRELYKCDPVRNAKTNALCSQLVKRLGVEDARGVVRFYLTHRKSYYLGKTHSLDCCVADCEGLRTQMISGHAITSTFAQQADQQSAVASAFEIARRSLTVHQGGK